MALKILVVDDEIDFLDSVQRALVMAGYEDCHLENDSRQAADRVAEGEVYDVALLDISMPGMSGLELLQQIKSTSPTTECIMVTAVNEVSVAVECMRRGAYDYLTKPISRDDLTLKVARALERRKLFNILELKSKETIPELANPAAFQEITTQTPKMLRLLREAELHAVSDVPILITGESGTGKELLAQAIHRASRRSSRPFTAVNMASVSDPLFDAEFFGHTKGAFTGAERDRVGYLEHTSGGTLFLDEIGHLPPSLQGKLLRVLQEGEYMKLGSSRPQKVDIRFIAATNMDIEQMVRKGSFRQDLYYRLKGAWLHLPPLSERAEDIPLLINRFLEEVSTDGSKITFRNEALELLLNYNYPGNIRELKSILHASANLAQGGQIGPQILPDYVRLRPRSSTRPPKTAGRSLTLEELEKQHILRVYSETGKNKTQAARQLGIGINTLRRKLDSYGEQ
ncbi:MAG: sigma-54-dependent transcriptional regulator [Syntrophobacteraceae bacterium]